jgi:hypothetical protein
MSSVFGIEWLPSEGFCGKTRQILVASLKFRQPAHTGDWFGEVIADDERHAVYVQVWR